MDALLEWLLQQQAAIRHSLGSGVAQSMEEYRALVGELRGLQRAQERLEAILRADEDDD